MKKIFTFFAAMMATVAINATIVTLVPSDFTAVSAAAAIDQTVKDVKVQVSNGVINADQIRVYKNSTLTISAEKEISALVFTCTASGDAQYGPGCFNAQDGYSYKGVTGTWLGNAASVAFTAGSAQVRLTQIDVYFDGEKPAEDTWVADTVSVSAARALITAEDKHDHYVVGVVASAPANSYDSFNGKVDFWLTDVEQALDSLQAYQVLGPENAKWASLDDAKAAIHVGDTVLMYAATLKKYESTYEIGAGNFVKVLGANPDAPQEKLDTLTAAEALERAQALPVDGTEKVAVLCLVASIKQAYDSTYKNITVWLNDDPTSTYGVIQAYRAKCAAEVGTTLAEHDKVLIVGNLSHTTYKSGDETKDSYQIAQGAQLTLIEKAPQGIEEVVLTEKANKVMIDGVMYIIRDNKMYNVQGTQVR